MQAQAALWVQSCSKITWTFLERRALCRARPALHVSGIVYMGGDDQTAMETGTFDTSRDADIETEVDEPAFIDRYISSSENSHYLYTRNCFMVQAHT